MIVVLKQNPNRHQLESLIAWLQEKGIIIHTSIGEAHTILGLVGDTSQLDIDLIAALDIVEDVKRVQEPYKKKFNITQIKLPFFGSRSPTRMPTGSSTRRTRWCRWATPRSAAAI